MRASREAACSRRPHGGLRRSFFPALRHRHALLQKRFEVVGKRRDKVLFVPVTVGKGDRLRVQE